MVLPVGPYEHLKGLLKNFCTGESFLKVPFSNLHIEMKHPEQISCLVKNGPSSGTIDPTLGAFLENLHKRNFLRNGFPYIIRQVDQNLYVKPFGQKWSHKTLLEPRLEPLALLYGTLWSQKELKIVQTSVSLRNELSTGFLTTVLVNFVLTMCLGLDMGCIMVMSSTHDPNSFFGCFSN